MSIDYSNLSEEDSIEELHLTNRSFNALTRACIRTVGEVSRLVDSGRLRTTSGLGKKSSLEIEAKVVEVRYLDGAGVDTKIDSGPDQGYVYLSPEEPIKKLNLSRRSFNALTRVNIRTVREVLQLAESGELKAIRGLGGKCILEIEDSLAQAKIHDVSEVEAHTYATPDRDTASFSLEDSIRHLSKIDLCSYGNLGG